MEGSAVPHVHATAVISPEAQLAPDVTVGPLAVIEGPVRVGAGSTIAGRAHLIGPLTLGTNNQIHSGAVLGGDPQHLGYKGEPTNVEIGNASIFREHCTVHRGMPVGVGPGTGTTKIGDRCLLMAGAHVAHDCVVGNDVILVNGALLGGHVTVGDRALISGNSAIHQFCRVGRLALLSGTSASTKDVPPFWVMQNVNCVRGLNLIGMKRAGMPPGERAAVRKAFQIIYLSRPALLLSAAVNRIEAELGHFAAIRELVEFIRTSKRGIAGAHRYVAGDDGDSLAA
jgi:UDP-N-acetylglucosamine acyltransferase